MSERGILAGIDYGDPVVKYRGRKILRIARLIAGREVEHGLPMAIDAFYALYLPAPIVDEEAGEAAPIHRALVEALLNSGASAHLRSRTIMDSVTSSVAAGLFLAETRAMARIASSQREGEGRSRELEGAARALAERIVDRVAREVEVVKRIKSLIEGQEAGRVSAFATEEYGYELLRLARNADVRRILEVLRGLKPWEIDVPGKRERSRRGEIHGYELGRDVERVATPSLVLPDELFYLKYVEGRLVIYEKALVTSRGPIYLLVDKSGSMDGPKMTWAKAVAIAMYMRALKESRELYFRFFDSVPYQLVSIGKKPRAEAVAKFVDYVARVKGSGGTDISRALLTACSDIRAARVGSQSDVVLITDGIDRVAEHAVSTCMKRANSRLVSVMIQGDNRSLKKISWKYYAVVKLDREDVLKVVEMK
ncbi:MAG: VWA domain-containing protein [Desulfurococcaceae archaeon]